MNNIALIISYDGTYYFGWQKTISGPTIEETLTSVLSRLLQENIVLQAASRTDKGVHAEGQVINFFTHKKIDVNKLQYSLNCLLPKDIHVLSCQKMDLSFHPTIDCIKKEYHYYLFYGKFLSPFLLPFVWHYPYPINLKKLKKAAEQCIGEKDFSSFCNETVNDGKRIIFHLEIEEIKKDFLRIKCIGDNFLYKMIRILVGTLAQISCNKILLSMEEIIQKKERKKAGITAPSSGLFLHKIHYSEKKILNKISLYSFVDFLFSTN